MDVTGKYAGLKAVHDGFDEGRTRYNDAEVCLNRGRQNGCKIVKRMVC